MTIGELVAWVERTAGLDHGAKLRAHIAALEQQNEQSLRLAESQSTAYGEAMVRVTALEKERDAALADNAELREQAVHGYECRPPYPGGCQCVLSKPRPGAALLEVVNAIRQYQRADEPDVSVTLRRLLEERGRIAHMVPPDQHRKALVRARNEGREEAATQCEAMGRERPPSYHFPVDLNGVALTELAARIRARMEPAPCCERDTDGDGNCDRHPAREP